jgi:hypothetical protein
MPGHRAGHPDALSTVFRDGRDKPGHEVQFVTNVRAMTVQPTATNAPVFSSRIKSSPVATPK